MPASAVLAAMLWRLPPAQAAGVCLVGCCPGGVASNVVSLLARADVPLSITMTTCSTVAACFLTPILAALCAGAKAELNRAALAASTVQVVLAPVALGLALRSFFPKKCDRAQPFLAPTAALLVAWICGSVVAKNSAGAAAAGAGRVLGALLCLHGLGFGLGYAAAKAAGLDEAARRTVSIETGMQNSAPWLSCWPAPRACRRPRSCPGPSAPRSTASWGPSSRGGGGDRCRRSRGGPRPSSSASPGAERRTPGVRPFVYMAGRVNEHEHLTAGTLLALHTKYYHK